MILPLMWQSIRTVTACFLVAIFTVPQNLIAEPMSSVLATCDSCP